MHREPNTKDQTLHLMVHSQTNQYTSLIIAAYHKHCFNRQSLWPVWFGGWWAVKPDKQSLIISLPLQTNKSKTSLCTTEEDRLAVRSAGIRCELQQLRQQTKTGPGKVWCNASLKLQQGAETPAISDAFISAHVCCWHLFNCCPLPSLSVL